MIRVGLARDATFCTVSAADAQSTYVGASALAEIARFGTAGGPRSPGGEAFGFALRVGTAIADRFGVDLEFTRPGEIEDENSFDLALGIPVLPGLGPGGMPIGGGRPDAIFPPFTITTSHRYSTLTVMPYVRQSLGSRAEIVYLGGVGFVRTTSSVDFDDRVRILLGSRLESVVMRIRPAVGLDIRVSMTDHLRLVTGVRMLAVDAGGRGGWLAGRRSACSGPSEARSGKEPRLLQVGPTTDTPSTCPPVDAGFMLWGVAPLF
jgi:hypothetical protein